MRRARLLVLALIGLGLTLTGVSTATASRPIATWDAPTDGEYLTELPLTGSASDPDAADDGSGGGIVSVTYDLQAETPEEPGDPCTAAVDEDERQQTYEEPVPTVDLELPAEIPCNRRYTVRVTITTEPVGPPDDVQPETTILETPIAVAVPPASPVGLAVVHSPGSPDYSDDHGTVRLTWDENPEPDIVGYVVHRSAPGSDGYEVAAEVVDTEWIDTEIDYGGEYGYRVDAVRAGPDQTDDDGELTTVRSERPAGVLLDVPGPPPPTTTTTTSAPAEQPGDAGATGAAPIQRPPNRPPSPPTTVDTGYEGELDYGQEAAAVPEPGEGEAQVVPEPIGGDAAVVATFDEDDEERRKEVLVPIAGGLALFVGALHIRYIASRAAQPSPATR